MVNPFNVVMLYTSKPYGRSDMMADSTVTVDAGVCRFKTVITATMDDEMNIVFKIKSECPAVRNMAKEMGPVPLFEAMAMPFTENAIYKYAAKLEHVACPVPCALVKTAEVTGDMALKKEVSIKIE